MPSVCARRLLAARSRLEANATPDRPSTAHAAAESNHGESQPRSDPAQDIRAWMALSEQGLSEFARIKRGADSVRAARTRQIRRTKLRRKLSAQRFEVRRKRSQETWPSKPPTKAVLRPRGLRPPMYEEDVKRARQVAFSRIARAEGISVKALKRIASMLAYRLVQELIGAGSVTLPRIGRLRLRKLAARNLSVNLHGSIGRGGQRGLVFLPARIGIQFRASATLSKALRESQTAIKDQS